MNWAVTDVFVPLRYSAVQSFAQTWLPADSTPGVMASVPSRSTVIVSIERERSRVVTWIQGDHAWTRFVLRNPGTPSTSKKPLDSERSSRPSSVSSKKSRLQQAMSRSRNPSESERWTGHNLCWPKSMVCSGNRNDFASQSSRPRTNVPRWKGACRPCAQSWKPIKTN